MVAPVSTSSRRGRTGRSKTYPCAHHISFHVPGPLLGYRASARRAFDPRYKAYKEAVRLYALAAGLARVQPPPGARPRLSVTIAWCKGARIDWDNVVKAIQDALFGQDREVDPGTFEVRRDSGAEYAEVEVTWGSR